MTIHDGSNWDVKIGSIPEIDFHEKMMVLYVESKINGDSLLQVFANNYEVIVISDSCALFKGLDKNLELCRRTPKDDKLWTGYDVLGYENGFLIVMDWAYESWAYISFDPVTQKYLYSTNELIFIDRNIIYAAGNYYGFGEFQIANLENGEYFGFESNWELTGFYELDRKIYLRFSSGSPYEYNKYFSLNF